MRVRFLALIGVVAVLQLGCRTAPRIAELEVDENGCSRPRFGVLSNSNAVELAVGGIGPLTTGRINIKNDPALLKLMTDAAQDQLVVQYLLCKAARNGEIDFTNATQVNYLRQFFTFMVSRPTADQVLTWQAAHPFPRPSGRLVVAAEAEFTAGVRVIRFTSANEVTKKIVLSNTGDAPLRWWCDGFIPAWVFMTANGVPLAVDVRHGIDPGRSQTIEITRTTGTGAVDFDFTLLCDHSEVFPFRIAIGEPAKVFSLSSALESKLLEALNKRSADSTADTTTLIAAAREATASLGDFSALTRSFLAGQLLRETRHDEAAFELYRAALLELPELHNDRTFVEQYARFALAAGQLETGAAELKRLVDQLELLRSSFPSSAGQRSDADAAAQRLADLLATTANQAAELRVLRSANSELGETAAMQADALSRLTIATTELRSRLEKLVDTHKVFITGLRSSLTVTVAGRVLFHSGAAYLNAEGVALLNHIGDILRSTIDQQYIVVRGHADDRPVHSGYRNNKDLAFARADVVASRLASRGLDRTRIIRESFGDEAPVGDNLTPEGRAENRRVEIVIYPDLAAMQNAVSRELSTN